MLWEIPPLIKASSDPLWRYMSFPAYVAMLATESLWFSRLDRLNDPFEGTRPRNLEKRDARFRERARRKLQRVRQRVEKMLMLSLPDDVMVWPDIRRLRTKLFGSIEDAIEEVAESFPFKYIEDTIDNTRRAEEKLLSPQDLRLWRACTEAIQAQFTLQILSGRGEDSKRTFVNCWHANEGESFAMWNLYSRDGLGVVVRTTNRRFLGELEKHSGHGDWEGRDTLTFSLCRVTYADPATFRAPRGFVSALLKRKAFSHEREVRAVTGLIGKAERMGAIGIAVRVDLKKLVTEVLVHPDSPSWFFEAVRDVTRRYSFPAARVKRSRLRERKRPEVVLRARSRKIRYAKIPGGRIVQVQSKYDAPAKRVIAHLVRPVSR